MHTTPADGNIFEDIGYPPDEARSLFIRSGLMVDIKQLIKQRHLTQAKAATLFGVTQPRISDLVRGKIDRFSIDTLIGMLVRAGMNVTLAIEPRAA